MESHEMDVMPNDVAAISVGMVDGEVWTDLDYILDSNADVDMNVVMTSAGEFVEVQGTGEEATYSRKNLDSLIDAERLEYPNSTNCRRTSSRMRVDGGTGRT